MRVGVQSHHTNANAGADRMSWSRRAKPPEQHKKTALVRMPRGLREQVAAICAATNAPAADVMERLCARAIRREFAKVVNAKS